MTQRHKIIWFLIRVTFLPGTLDSQSEDDKEYVEASEKKRFFYQISENTARDFSPKWGQMGHGPDMNFGFSRYPQLPFCKNFARLYMFDRSACH